jgi:hypothetical protein
MTSTTTTETITVVPATPSGAGAAAGTGVAGIQNFAGGAPGCAAGHVVTETVKMTITVTASPSTPAAPAMSSSPIIGASAGTSAVVHAASSQAPSASWAPWAAASMPTHSKPVAVSSAMPPSVSAGAFFGNGTAVNATSKAWASTGFLTLSKGRAMPSGGKHN